MLLIKDLSLKYIIPLLYLFAITTVMAQNELATISGTVTTKTKPIPFADIYVMNSTVGTSTDIDGKFTLNVPSEKTIVIVSKLLGFRSMTKQISIEAGTSMELNFSLVEDVLGLEKVVVSATRNRINKKETPVIVNVLGPKLFKATQSISLADGLNYQPGVRVETNCQNCGFIQVRLNGLEGQYTQILVNSRPVFSALNGVYGLEQIPVNIIDRVEVVRSGGSALFGSNAIAGTINIITKEPVNDSWEISTNFGITDGTALDRNINLNTSLVSEDLRSCITVYGIFRDR